MLRVRYFVVDHLHQLRKLSPALVEQLWTGRVPVSRLGFPIGKALRVISVLCDTQLRPRVIFFLRLALSRGVVTDAAREMAYQTIVREDRAKLDRSTFLYQMAGWPNDWRRQLAVALDVPVAELNRISVGGPLPIADLMGVSVRQSLRFFEEAANG